MNSLGLSKQLKAIFANGVIPCQERRYVLCSLLRTVEPLLTLVASAWILSSSIGPPYRLTPKA